MPCSRVLRCAHPPAITPPPPAAHRPDRSRPMLTAAELCPGPGDELSVRRPSLPCAPTPLPLLGRCSASSRTCPPTCYTHPPHPPTHPLPPPVVAALRPGPGGRGLHRAAAADAGPPHEHGAGAKEAGSGGLSPLFVHHCRGREAAPEPTLRRDGRHGSAAAKEGGRSRGLGAWLWPGGLAAARGADGSQRGWLRCPPESLALAWGSAGPGKPMVLWREPKRLVS